jgi:hypothetical protein
MTKDRFGFDISSYEAVTLVPILPVLAGILLFRLFRR